MRFEPHQFSKRFPAVECALFVVHEPPIYGEKRFRPGVDPAPKSPEALANWYRGTAAAIILPDGRYWAGVTLCSPQDQFVKAIGRAKATGRAFHRMVIKNDCNHGNVTIIEAINEKPIEPRIGSVDALLDDLRGRINNMKRDKGIL